ncbi:vitamin K epoxide reductase complex subunit 1-like [Dendronephthya gigantea]|uniref:vitamin K epoxide reductase complex subunit 1-like n=1 Tax=Dendronephthya gigantea TaxID=151771 RepID=UPI00106BB504|nr:vitamin K epoxide reductase complex subunit 1-like [Dendronephthya gigantea]
MAVVYPWFHFVRSFRTFLCLLGIVLSIYALYVEVKKMQDKSFVALCDIHSKMSCSKVFSSKYGTGFGLVEPLLGKDSIFNIPNSIYGIAFYIFVLSLGFFDGVTVAWIVVINCILSCVGCVYLAYILYYILEDFCIVCVSTYVVNALLLVLSIYHLVQLPSPDKPHRE